MKPKVIVSPYLSPRIAWSFAFIAIVVITILPGAASGFAHASSFAMPDKIIRISANEQGTPANGESHSPVISPDGTFVAFSSRASNLVSGDTNAMEDVFLVNIPTRQVQRISTTSLGNESNGHSSHPSLAADGRYVVFESGATNLVPGDTNAKWDIFVKDTQTGSLDRVSIHTNGTQGNGDSSFPVISGDGRLVAFVSDASNLIGADLDLDGTCELSEGCDTNGISDVFIYNRVNGSTERVSVSSSGGQIQGGATGPIFMTSTGRFVLFYSRDSHIDPADPLSDQDIFIHDRLTGQTSLVTYTFDGQPENVTGPLYVGPIASDDGRYTVYQSFASNVVPGDTNGASDIFLYDRQLDQTRRVSVFPDGSQISGSSISHGMSPDGRFIAFESSGKLAPTDQTPYTDMYVRDMLTGQYMHVSLTETGGQVWKGSTYGNPVLSANGAYIAFTADVDLTSPASDYTDIFFTPVMPIYVVNSTADRADQNPADNACHTGQQTAEGKPECTLRAAIQQANARAGTESIHFDLPGSGTPLIQPTSSLPAITGPTLVDGTTQPGAGRVRLDGQLSPANTNGLQVTGGNSFLRGLAITRFPGHGVWIQGGSNSQVENCWIGLAEAGRAPAGNGGDGILMENSSHNRTGGTLPGQGNRIAYNQGRGVAIIGNSTENAILANAIFSNQGLGIDLGKNGATPNDPWDADTGPNQYTNTPEFSSLITQRDVITGVLDARANTLYRVEIFANESCNPSGYGEGEQYLGFVQVATDGQGVGQFTLHTEAHAEKALTLTATDNENNTSEFSHCRSLVMYTPSFQNMEFPDMEWAALGPAGTVEGNIVRIVTQVRNRGATTENVEMLYIDAETGVLLPNGQKQLTLQPGQLQLVEYFWDTEGFAWKPSGAAHPDPRQIEVRLRDLPAYLPEVQFGEAQSLVAVQPKPIILVHGWASGPATWNQYAGFAQKIHPAWQVRAANNLDTGSALWFGKSLAQNATSLKNFIDLVRDELNAWHVDLVVHSKGGLVSRAYIHGRMAPREWDNKPLVSHLVMLGTPNRGSPCADLIPTRGAYELTPGYVDGLFNKKVINRKGVAFSILAGIPMKFTCTAVEVGDSVVAVSSAIADGLPLVRIHDASYSTLLHTDMTTSEYEFLVFVVPRLKPAPAGQPRQEDGLELALLSPDEETTNPQLAYTGVITLPAQTVTAIEFPVTQALTLGVTLACPPAITTTLVSPSAAFSTTIPANSEAALQPLRTLLAPAPEPGNWHIQLENPTTEDIQVAGSAWLLGSLVQLTLEPGVPNLQGVTILQAALAGLPSPQAGAAITVTLVGSSGIETILSLFDDGNHTDGAAGDGTFANLTPALPVDVYRLAAQAAWPGGERQTLDFLEVAQADLQITITPSAEDIRTGDTLTFTSWITNAGPSDLLSAEITYTLPATFTVLVVQASNSGCSLSGHTLSCTMSLLSGETANVQVKGKPTQPGMIQVGVEIHADEPDPQPENNQAGATVNVQPHLLFLPIVTR